MDVHGEIHFATVGAVKNPGIQHVFVYPDDDGRPVEEPMPPPRILVLLRERADKWGLYCYDAEGEFAGDTEHKSYGDALDHAKRAYGNAVGRWQRAHVGNVEEFVRKRLGVRGPSGGAA